MAVQNETWKISLGALNVGDIEIGDEHGDIVATVETMRRRYDRNPEKAWETAQTIEASPKLLSLALSLVTYGKAEQGLPAGVLQLVEEAKAALPKFAKGA